MGWTDVPGQTHCGLAFGQLNRFFNERLKIHVAGRRGQRPPEKVGPTELFQRDGSLVISPCVANGRGQAAKFVVF